MMISQRYNEQMGNYLAKLAKASKPPTNADRIRSMPDEELANELHYMFVAYDFRNPEDILEWLQSPVEVDDG